MTPTERSPSERRNGGLPAPLLLVGDTAEMIDQMGLRWELPSSVSDPEKIIRPWLRFCDLVIEGRDVIRQLVEEGESLAEEGKFRPDIEALGAWNYSRRILQVRFEEREERIEAARRAFGALLGMGKMKPGDADEARELVRACEKELEGGFPQMPLAD